MAYPNQLADDDLQIDVSGDRAEVLFFFQSNGGPPIPDKSGMIRVTVSISDWENKSRNEAKVEALAKARPLFNDLIRAFRGKED